MPVFRFGDMFTECWNRSGTMFCVTTNEYVNRFGELVMGRGAALQLSRMVPGLNKMLGEMVSQMPHPYHFLVIPVGQLLEKLGRYHVLMCDIGLFQVKQHFADDADVVLMIESAQQLIDYAKHHPNTRININYPGIGYGHLVETQVAPIIKTFPSNVHVWRFPHQRQRMVADHVEAEG